MNGRNNNIEMLICIYGPLILKLRCNLKKHVLLVLVLSVWFGSESNYRDLHMRVRLRNITRNISLNVGNPSSDRNLRRAGFLICLRVNTEHPFVYDQVSIDFFEMKKPQKCPLLPQAESSSHTTFNEVPGRMTATFKVHEKIPATHILTSLK